MLPDPSTNHYTGGLLVNDGSGWQVDEGAAAAMGAERALGGRRAARRGRRVRRRRSVGLGLWRRVIERSGPGAPWQQTPTPLPGGDRAGLAGAVSRRRSAAGDRLGQRPEHLLARKPAHTAARAFRPNLIAPYPLSAEYGAGHVVRQTAGGWSDEEHELNNVQEPPGNYLEYDLAYQPDPISAVLINPAGTEGWAVGGFVDTADSNGALDTADVERYPADGVTPPGVDAPRR